MTFPRRRPRLRTALALAALSLALWAAFLRPLPAFVASGIPYGSYAGAAPARPLAQGDHLQLLYHFDLFDSYLRGRLPWFRNLWEFNTSDEARPARPDPCYFPFALPYSLARSAGASDALAWNLSQWLSVLLGLAFCFALARRFGAGPVAALAVAALASCVPYRWVVLAGGSPTGFGMGLVPGVALGVDVAVRDRRLRGGALAGALLVGCYAADLHCFLFAALAVPLWGLAALLRAPANPFARRRLARLARALSPLALGAALCLAAGLAARRAYASTDAAGGRTLRDLARHSPDWHAFFDPFYFSHAPEQLHQGWVFAALLSLAGLSLLAAAVALLWRLLRRRREAPFRSPAIVFDPRFSTRVEAPAPRDSAAFRAALAGLLLGAAIVAAFFLALGTNGPGDALLLRAVRKLVPPFRMVRQPLKVLCLLPTLYAAFLAAAWSSRRAFAPLLRRAAALPALSRLAAGQRARGAAAPRRRASAALRALPAAALVLAAFLSASRGMRAGVCLLPGPNAAYASAVADAEARGLEPRALVLPIWPGDSSWSSIYQYHAMRAGLRMLNGYAAVTEPEYVERVFRRFETMTEGDLTADQAAALRKMGVTHVILHEDAFPAKVSLFPFGATLRRHLASPCLRLLSHDSGAWAFAIRDRGGNAECRMRNAESTTAGQASSIQHSASSIQHSALEPPTRHWGVRPPQTNAATKVRSFAEIHREGYGWLVRAEADKELVLVSSFKDADRSIHAVTNRFPAVEGAVTDSWRLAFLPALDPSSNLWTHLSTPGEAAISYVAYARDPALGGLPAPGSGGVLRLAAADLLHEFGSTEPDPASPAGDPLAGARLSFAPGPHPPCTAVEGPWLPLALPAGRYRASLDATPGAFRLDGADGVEDLALSSDGTFADFSYDGTSPVSFRVSYAATRPGVLSAIAVSPR